MTSDVKPGLSFEAEMLAYYSEYGKALAQWGIVEFAMLQVAEVFYPAGMPRHMLNMGFTGIQGFHSKLQFVDRSVTRGIAAIKVVDKNGNTLGSAQGILQPRWSELAQRLDGLSSARNHLAHYVTKPFPSYTREGRRIALCDVKQDKGTPDDRPPPGSYTVKKLICVRRSFEAVTIDLVNFAHRLCGLPEPLEQSGKPEDDLPTTQQIADQMHAALGHQRVSAKQRKKLEDMQNALASLENAVNVKRDETPDTNNG